MLRKLVDKIHFQSSLWRRPRTTCKEKNPWWWWLRNQLKIGVAQRRSGDSAEYWIRTDIRTRYSCIYKYNGLSHHIRHNLIQRHRRDDAGHHIFFRELRTHKLFTVSPGYDAWLLRLGMIQVELGMRLYDVRLLIRPHFAVNIRIVREMLWKIVPCSGKLTHSQQ